MKYFSGFLLLFIGFIVTACQQPPETSVSATTTEPFLYSSPVPTFPSKEVIIAPEHMIQTQNAFTQTVLPTTLLATLSPTQPLALVPTLTAIPNSTPTSQGAYFDVPSDVLGPPYEIENAYYFDDLQTGERYEFYAGALAGSGDEETAQGVMVLRVLRFSKAAGDAEVVATQEYLTPIQVGPLHIRADFTGSILLFSPLHFEWTYSVRHGAMIDIGNPPLARLEIGEDSQLAGRGSFCWKGTCADFGIYTSSIPLVVQSPFTAHLHLPLTEPPDGLWMYTMAVSPPGPLQYDEVSDIGAYWSTEKPGRQLVDQGSLLLRQDQDIKLSLEPGYHILVIFAAWRDYGDVKYGFLIEVQD